MRNIQKSEQQCNYIHFVIQIKYGSKSEKKLIKVIFKSHHSVVVESEFPQ
jgi:hypothetical protein